MKINYKSDFELDYTLLDEHGQPIAPPDCPWKLVLSVGNPLKPYVGQCGCANGRNFVAEYDGENYHNCRVQDNVIRVFVDNHGLPCGQLWATFITYTPNPDFPDGNRRVYTPQATDTFLVAEAGDDPTPAQIQYTANYVVFEHEYTAGQGITIENDVISATGESYTAGSGIEIANGEISLSQGTLDELESHDADIRDLITSVNSLERGNERAVRLTDTTTTGEAGKVVKIDETVVGTTYSRITADIFDSKMVESDGGVCYAFPSSSDEVKANADDMLLASGDKAELEQQINGKASSSDVTTLANRVTTAEGSIADLTTGKADQSDLTALGNRVSTIEGDYVTDTELAPISQDVNTLTTNYNSIVNALNQEITELIAGKAMIASALTDRGYPTQATDSSASMAQKIENMAYDAGWLAQLGYSETNDGGVKDAVAYSKAIKDGWNPAETSRRFTNDEQLVYFSDVDCSQFTSMASMFSGCKALSSVNNINTPAVQNFGSMFMGCRALRYVCNLNTSNATNTSNMFYECMSLWTIGELDVKNVTICDSMFKECSIKDVPYLNFEKITSATELFRNAKVIRVRGINAPLLTSVADMFYKTNNTLERVDELIIPSVTNYGTNNGKCWCSLASDTQNLLKFLLVKGLATPQSVTTIIYYFNQLAVWGADSEENRQSLVKTLRDYSYDRVTAGYSTCTIKLHADTLARLTAQEIEDINDKGYTLTT